MLRDGDGTIPTENVDDSPLVFAAFAVPSADYAELHELDS